MIEAPIQPNSPNGTWPAPKARALKNAEAAVAYMDSVRVDMKKRWADLEERLTKSQMAVLSLLAHGLSDQEAAMVLDVANGTINSHRAAALDAMHLSYWVTHRGTAIAAYWAWRESQRRMDAVICSDSKHCQCADILEGISDES